MTTFAGIFLRDRGERILEPVIQALAASVARGHPERVTTHRGERACFAALDLGAFEEPALQIDAGGGVLLLAGEPLLRADGEAPYPDRGEETRRLLAAGGRQDMGLLAHARGTFCGAYFEPEPARLLLFNDRLGVRPLYYWANERYLVFASALRILEALPLVPKQLDLRAVTEIAGFGFPLGDRSPYAEIRTLRAAEVVAVSGTQLSRSRYWRWDRIEPAREPEAALLAEARRRFDAAVERRLRGDRSTLAYLSGGLDSRVVVTALHGRGVALRTFNYAPPGTQDQVFAAQYARALGTQHREFQVAAPADAADAVRRMVAEELDGRPASECPERPRAIWSGDGGSVGVGHVYLSRRLVELLRSGQRDAAIDHFLQQQGAYTHRRILRRSLAPYLAEVPREGILEELADIECEDPARGFHLFLMLNDQRRHLAEHFERIDRDGMELQLPFFDGDFLEHILSLPLELCLEHRFYLKWLGHFPPVVTSVPWQAYPGHLPCPIPIPPELGYQWDHSRAAESRKRRKRVLLREAQELLAADFPSAILNRGVLRLATWMHRFGVRDYEYLIRAAQIYQKHWRVAGGHYVLST